MQLSKEFRSLLESGMDLMAVGADEIARTLPPVEPGRFLDLNADDGSYEVKDEQGFGAGFLAGKMWMLYDYFGKESYGDAAAEITRWCASLAPRTEVDIGFVSQYAPAMGYELTGEAWMKEQALTGCASFVKNYNPELGLLMVWPPDIPKPDFVLQVPRKVHDWESYIDSAACSSVLWWARRFEPKYGEIAHTQQESVRRWGLIQAGGRVHHLIAFDPASGEPIEFHTAQGYDDHSQWTRAQGWGMNSSVFAFEATGESQFLVAAVETCDYFQEHMLPDTSTVPFYDLDDPRIPDIARDTCSTTLAINAMVRLMQEQPELEPRYAAFVERAIAELLESHTTPEGIVIHGSWGNMHSDVAECVMPYGNLYLTETLYRLLRPGKDVWGIRSPIQNGLDQA